MAVYMFAFVVFLSAFMVGVKDGVLGLLTGLAVGVGMGITFYFGIAVLFRWVPRRLGISEPTPQKRFRMFAGWMLMLMAFIWLILAAFFAFWLTKFLLKC